MSRTASQGSSRYKLHHPHPQHVSRSQEAAADSTSRSLSPSSHFPLNSSPQLSTQLEVHSKHWDVLPLLQKSTLGKNKTPPPPPPTSHLILPSVIPFHLYLLLKAKNQAPGLLGAGRLGLETPSWAAEGRHGSERSRGRRPGSYLGTEGGEAGELGGAGSHTSHRRSAGGSGRSDSRVLREDLPQSLNVNDKKRGCSGRR